MHSRTFSSKMLARLIKFTVLVLVVIGLICHILFGHADVTDILRSGYQKTNEALKSAEKEATKEAPKEHKEETTKKNPAPLPRILSSPSLSTESAEAPHERVRATFVTLARNRDLYSLLESVKSVEDRFNHKYKYDWVFFNDLPFTYTFQEQISNMVSGTAHFHIIPKEHWGYPDWIDQDKAAENRKKLVEQDVIYGGSESYRHMCRFESGFFWKHVALENYKYYWRVEPGVKFLCDAQYDYFKFMEDNHLRYGFSISLLEYEQTIPTLWQTTKQFVSENPQFVHPNNLAKFVTDDNSTSYNLCHFWSNFEIADLDFYRSDAYSKYFDYLDNSGGFFYERWGDAPVHSIAASLFLNQTEIHHFEDIGYEHPPFQSCPSAKDTRLKGKCYCDPGNNFTWQQFSCTRRFYESRNMPLPPRGGISPVHPH